MLARRMPSTRASAHAHGDILAWLNSDDTWLPGAVSCGRRGPLDQYPDCGLDLRRCQLHRRQRSYHRPLSRRADRAIACLRQGYVHIPQQAAFFRADLWRQVGPLDPSLYFAMDYDLWLADRAADAGTIRSATRGPISACTMRPRPSLPTNAAGPRCCASTTAMEALRSS